MSTNAETTKISSCRICGAALERPESRFFYEPGLSRCCQCRTLQLNFSVKEQDALYPPFNKKSSPALKPIQLALEIFNFERLFFMRRGGIAIARGSSQTLLDVGCGAGSFLKFISSYFEPLGVEPFSFNPDTLPEMRKKIHFAPLATLDRPKQSIDVITFWQSLEHLDNPLEILQQCHALLKPEGKLLVSIPNIRSWQSRLFKGHWCHLAMPRHIVHYDRETAHALLRRAGFTPVFTTTFTVEYGLSGWAQSFLNLFFEKELLNKWVKARGEFEKTPGRFKTAKVFISLGAALLLTPVFILLELLAGLLSAGTVLNMVAIKSQEK